MSEAKHSSDIIRPCGLDDFNFVMDSWLSSWRKSRYAGVVRNCDYFTTTRTVIEDLLVRGAKIVVCDAGKTLKGWACAEVKDGRIVLHYIYVKDAFLRQGVEEALLAALPGDKPGWFTFYQDRFAKDRFWQHAPEMARRKDL